MGTWGTGLYSDDLAADLRQDLRVYVGEGLSFAAAVDRLKSEYSSSVTDADESAVFWLAIADTGWRLGRLDDSTRQEALKIIERQRSGRFTFFASSSPRRGSMWGACEGLCSTLRRGQVANVVGEQFSTWGWELHASLYAEAFSGRSFHDERLVYVAAHNPSGAVLGLANQRMQRTAVARCGMAGLSPPAHSSRSARLALCFEPRRAGSYADRPVIL